MLPWIEKYRPQTIDKIVGNDELKTLLTTILTNHIKMPHFIFYGTPGNGKTSSILAFAHELYGKSFEYNVLQLNASINKGIDSVRNIILSFIKRKAMTNQNNVDYTMIILDEADALTVDAQSSLRKIIEQYTETTKFCIICNYMSKIIYPIVSRCMPIYFKPLSKDNITNQLQKISVNENLYLDDKIIDAIIETSNNDMRKCIGLLQNIKYYYQKNFKISQKLIYDINDDISNEDTIKIYNDILMKPMNEEINYIVQQSIPLKKLCEKLLLLCDLNINITNNIFKIIENINNGADIYIQTCLLVSLFK